MRSACWEKWGGGQARHLCLGCLGAGAHDPYPRLRRHSVRYRQQRWMDGQNTLFRTRGMQHKHFGSSSNGTIVKTEAPGLRGVGRVLEPQAWPGTSLPHTLPHSPIYTVGIAMLGVRASWREGSRRGRAESRPGPEAGPWGCGWGKGPDSGWVAPGGPRGSSEVTLGTGGTAASHTGS